METMHAAGRRRLPPVPRPAGARSSTGQPAVATVDQDADQFATQVIDTRQIAAEAAEAIEAELAALEKTAASEDDDALDATQQLPPEALAALLADDDLAEDAAPDDGEAEEPDDGEAEEPDDGEAEEPDVPSSPSPETHVQEQDPAQLFVAQLRSSATDFAAAAGAESAVVREAVPPARHRRARCRLVLRYADGDLVDVTLLGPAGTPGRPSRHGFDRQILRWLSAGLVQDARWIVDDPDAPEGAAVDLTAWVATG
jgi:hypothetical protein